MFLERVELAEAAHHFARALALARTLGPGDSAIVAEAWTWTAMAALRRHDAPAAAEALAQLAAFEPGSPALLKARIFEVQAQAARDDGRYAEAFERAVAALDVREAAAGEETDRLDAAILVGDLEWFLRRFEAARDRYRDTVERATTRLGRDHPITARALGGWALGEHDLGNAIEARTLAEEALAISTRVRGPDHPETSDRLQDLANFLQDLGEYAAAESLYEQATAIAERRFTTQSDEVATLRYNVAVLEWRTGRLLLARQGAEQALATWEGIYGRDHPYLGRPLDLLATVCLETGDSAAAEGALQRAIEIHERRGTSANLDAAWSLARLAEVQRERGLLEDARRSVERAAALADHASPETKGRAGALMAVGDAEMHLGRADLAAAHFRAAVERNAAALGNWHPATSSATARLASALLAVGDEPGALAAARDADDNSRAHLRRTLRYVSEGQALDLVRRTPEARDVLLSLAARRPEEAPLVAAALDATAGSRGLVFDELARRAGTKVADRSDLARERQRLARLLYRQAVQPSEDRAPLLAEARQAVERLERTAAGAAREEGPDEHRISSLGSRLGPGVNLVSFVQYRDPVQRQDEYLAFVISGSRPLRAVRLGAAAPIDAAVAAWRDSVQDVARAVAKPALSERTSRAAGRAVARLVWEPVADLLDPASLTLIVPDGSLFLVSFAALPLSDGSYLVEHARVHEISAERDTLRPARAAHPPSLLVAGGPEFGQPPVRLAAAAPPLGTRGAWGNCTSVLPSHFESLPSAAAEVGEVEAMWRRRSARAPLDALVGRDATESAFKRLAPGRTVLHVATHGFFATPCSTGARARIATEESLAWAANPLLATGVAMAGANTFAPGDGAAPADADDGLLTASEVAQLDLSSAELVVLSACGSGLGRAQAREGVLGFYRAFALAGAGSVVVSLWSVEDTEARAFARALYEARWQGGLSVAASVRRAHLAMLNRLRRERGAAPPSLWAPFVAVGDWR